MNLRPIGKTRVLVNGVEVVNSPVEEPEVRVEVIEPMPPLPVKVLPPFTDKPICAACNGRVIAWQFWPGFHDGVNCFVGVYAPYPYMGFLTRENQAETERRLSEVKRVRDTVPPHHDLQCERCHKGWSMSAAETVS